MPSTSSITSVVRQLVAAVSEAPPSSSTSQAPTAAVDDLTSQERVLSWLQGFTLPQLGPDDVDLQLSDDTVPPEHAVPPPSDDVMLPPDNIVHPPSDDAILSPDHVVLTPSDDVILPPDHVALPRSDDVNLPPDHVAIPPSDEPPASQSVAAAPPDDVTLPASLPTTVAVTTQRQENPQLLSDFSDKGSFTWTILYAKLKADLCYYHLKWKGIDKALIDKADTEDWEKAKKSARYMTQTKFHRTILNRFQTEMRIAWKEKYTLDDIIDIQKNLNEIYGKCCYRIHVFDQSGKHLWSGISPSQRNILIQFADGNFSFVKNLGKLLNQRFFCCNCLATAKFKISHRCDSKCTGCHESVLICQPPGGEYAKECSFCFRFFLSPACYERHRKVNNDGSTSCGKLRRCRDCNRLYNTRNFGPGEVHKCSDTTWCQRCLRHTEPSKFHTCYTRSMTEATKQRNKLRESTMKLLIYDFETSQCVDKEEDGDPTDDDDFDYLDEHVVVSVVLRKACFACFDRTRKNKDAACDICGKKEKIIYYGNSNDVIGDFVTYILHERNNNAYIFAHYGGRYDFVILMKALLERKIQVDVIMKGRRIISGKITTEKCTLHIRDSYNLIPLPLASFKDAFGLNVEQKGEFPYLLIQEKYFGQHLMGMPELKYFCIGNKTEKKRDEFLKWYRAQDSNTPYDVDAELIRYNRIDVDILTLGLLEFRAAMLQLTNWDPLCHTATLASFALYVLRCDSIPPRTLCSFPERGYNNNRQQSDVAMRWMRWLMHETPGLNIQHVGNGGEKRIHLPAMSTFVDGFAIDSNGEGIIFEFSGCYYHGHAECYDPNGFNALCQQTFGALYAATLSRLEMLKLSQYRIVHVWECEVKSQLRKNTKMKEFFANCVTTRLIPRLAMAGGRTEAHATAVESDDDNRIVYLDVNSLYPSVMMSCEVPVGPVNVITNGFPETPTRDVPYRGLLHVTVLPPSNLRYPLLGIKMNQSLLFPLCRTCAANKSTARCNHTDQQRWLTATWTDVELRLATTLGYIVVKFHEVWEFKKFSNTLFSKYIKSFYTVKIRSSGWPSWVKTDSDRRKCLQNYKDNMGIELTMDQIEDNPALRSVSKLLLNTSWGKFAERPHTRQTLVCSVDHLGHLMDTKLHMLRGHFRVNDDTYIVALESDSEEVHSSPFGNVVLACFITSHARLKLYSMLQASNNQGLYCDTDSIIALIPRSINPFEHLMGDGLGLLTDEAKGKEIQSAVFGGAKQYGVKCIDEETGEVSYILKIRGITIDADASRVLTFDKFKELVLSRKEIELCRFNLKRTHTSVQTELQKKKYKAVNEKGVSIHGIIYPYGYIPDDEQPTD